eukprot:Gregarina_sp_Poly_1__918@NODE_1220_length_4741_cov_416_879974_g832_i0_p2_GENE_NODE_1220_length_4741_cov_416_879974_g832_i0NODE_1220_length_4741_cov_416_879974_g832_i0_p2_ORF_typecomplete_len537_score73_08Integrin_beta/PF00362_18/2_1e18Integrin_beta/PF00362_18/1_6Dicty_REP/PF05086_12/0_00012Med3/PF11593_8/0_45Mucin15/PF15672_5/0_62_NODE_1220_length_4741_cov_416_879974_g832_i029664576
MRADIWVPLLCLSLSQSVAELTQTVSECPFNLELFILQDTSATFDKLRDEVVAQFEDAINRLESFFPGTQIAFASTVDKPIAMFGTENGRGGYVGNTDWCYRLEVPFTDDLTPVKNALLKVLAGGGLDAAEGQFEGIARALIDPSVNWTPPDIDFDPVTGNPILRILVMSTDDTMHYAGDGPAQIAEWNQKWGDPEWCNKGAVVADLIDECIRAGNLRPLIEAGTATPNEQAEFAQLEKLIGPRHYPDMPPHPYNLVENQDCSVYDYPDNAVLIQLLQRQKVSIINLVAAGEDEVPKYTAWDWWGKELEKLQDIYGSFTRLSPDAADFSDVLFAHIEKAAEKICGSLFFPEETTEQVAPMPTTSQEPLETTTTESTIETTTETIIETTTETTTGITTGTTMAETATAEQTTTMQAEATSVIDGPISSSRAEEATDPYTDTDVNNETRFTTTGVDWVSETTGSDRVDNVIGGGPKPGVIVGASVGAAVVASSGLLAAFGSSWWRRGESVQTSEVQVEVPEEHIEREAAMNVEEHMYC